MQKDHMFDTPVIVKDHVMQSTSEFDGLVMETPE